MDVQKLEDGVWCITLCSHRNKKGDCENRFNLEVVQALNKVLDEALQEGARAIVITGGNNNKFFSNGHDIEWLERNYDSGEADKFIEAYYKLMARFMSFPLPTVAAVNGHAFAGGCLLALAQDYRVMKFDKGFICMNEIDMVPETPPKVPSKIVPGCFKNADRKLMAILNAKINPIILRDMLLLGTRYTGVVAEQSGIVDIAVEQDVLEEAVKYAASLGKRAHKANRRTIAVLKYEQYRSAIEILTDGQSEDLHRNSLSRL